MNKLGAREKISPWQWAIMTIMYGIGSALITSSVKLVPLAQQAAWLSVLVSGGVFFGATYLMIRLGDLFPGQTVSQYFQFVWGKAIGLVLIWFLILSLLIEILIRLQIFAREVTFFMFDRTPPEVIILSMLLVSAYCAVQDLATVMRISQIFFFTALPMMIGIISLGYISFQFINIYPIWPINFAGVGRAIIESWVFFFGYEWILFLLPFIYRGNTSIVKAAGMAFATKAFLSAYSILMTIGAFSLEGTKGNPFPTMVAIRGVEVPGTFVERLDNYLFFIWIPIAFVTFAQFLHLTAMTLADLHGYKDYRPIVLLFIPILFIGSMAIHNLPVFITFTKIAHWPGLLFSFGIIPSTYLLARWRRHKQGVKLNAP